LYDPTTPATDGLAAAPLPLVVRQMQSRRQEAERQTGAGSELDPGRPQPGVVAPEHAQVDIERLADKVVGRINDRMIAHRERLGRM
jgi:hypothetical protein